MDLGAMARDLYDAAGKGSLLIVKALLSAGADPLAYHTPFSGWYPVHIAAQRGYMDVVAVLVDYDARQLELPAHERGDTPLYVAACFGAYKVVAYLLSRRAFIEARNATGHTPLAGAAHHGQGQVVNLLIGIGAHVSASVRAEVDAKQHLFSSARTPLHEIAAMPANTNVVDIITTLFQHGASLEAKDNFGMTPLIMAVCGGSDANVATLEIRRDRNGYTHGYEIPYPARTFGMSREVSIQNIVYPLMYPREKKA